MENTIQNPAIPHSSVENTYYELLSQLPAAVYTCNKDGFITYFNNAAAELWGRSPEIGKDMWSGGWKIFNGDGSPVSLDSCPMAIALKERRAVTGEEIIIEKPDGTQLNVLTHPTPLYDTNGGLTGALNMLVDITAQKKIEKQVRESENKFRSLANSVPVMIWMADNCGKINFLNQKWEECTGITADANTEDWRSNIHPEDAPDVLARYNTAFEKRIEFSGEYRIKGKDNTFRWLYSFGIPRFNSSGEFEGYIGSCQDITDSRVQGDLLKQLVEDATAELKWKNEELERSNAELASFSYVASHDLQEPLRKVITFADRLELTYKKDIPAGAIEYLDRIIESARRMSRLIEDLLEFSRVRSDENLQDTDLNEILKNVIADFDQRIAEKKARVDVGPLPVIPAIPLRMTQLFHNLISNALKFATAEQQPVTQISATSLSEKDIKANPRLLKGRKYTHITVSDNGIGFNPQFSERIFTIFQRLHGKSEYSGTGIGLALCRKITDYHKGIIYANGEEKKGAQFHVILPSEAAPFS